jgi:hypothetical protein
MIQFPSQVSYRRESLRDMCKEAGVWRSGNKRQLAAVLLSWRNRCRRDGQKFFAELQALGKAQPKHQLKLFQGQRRESPKVQETKADKSRLYTA